MFEPPSSYWTEFGQILVPHTVKWWMVINYHFNLPWNCFSSPACVVSMYRCEAGHGYQEIPWEPGNSPGAHQSLLKTSSNSNGFTPSKLIAISFLSWRLKADADETSTKYVHQLLTDVCSVTFSRQNISDNFLINIWS